MRDHVSRLIQGRWHYRRPATTAAVGAIAVLGTLVARAVLPPSVRPSSTKWVVLGSAGAYVAMRLSFVTGISKRFKHTYLDLLGGDVDDAHTWIVAALGGCGTLVLGQLVRRAVRRNVSRIKDYATRP